MLLEIVMVCIEKVRGFLVKSAILKRAFLQKVMMKTHKCADTLHSGKRDERFRETVRTGCETSNLVGVIYSQSVPR